MSPSDSFNDVMIGLNAGDEVAAAAVFNRFVQRLIALARLQLDARLRQKIDPEDVLQSVFRSFFQRQADGQFTLQGWDSLWSLLTVITVRKCRNVAEHFHAARRNVAREAAPEHSGIGSVTLARDPTPSEVLMLAETVEELVRGLPERDREILSLALQGYAADEISTQLQRPLRTVYRVLERIKKRLQRQQASDGGSS